MNMKPIFTIIAFLFFISCTTGKKESNENYANLSPIDELTDIWKITNPGEITWQVKQTGHIDHIEMSGLRVSVIAHYGVNDNGELMLNKKVVWLCYAPFPTTPMPV